MTEEVWDESAWERRFEKFKARMEDIRFRREEAEKRAAMLKAELGVRDKMAAHRKMAGQSINPTRH